jgi:hypothetical protein
MKYHKSVLGKLIATIIMSFMTYIVVAQSSTNCCSQAQIITYRKAAKLGDAKAMFELGVFDSDTAKDLSAPITREMAAECLYRLMK